jgi:hypothetical protein
VTDDVEFFSALEEEKHVIAQANAPIDKKGKFHRESRAVPPGGEFDGRSARGRHADGRVAEPAGLGGARSSRSSRTTTPTAP